ncbi:MAG: hypothetical protein Q9228_000670 [Teloschistes exilis]
MQPPKIFRASNLSHHSGKASSILPETTAYLRMCQSQLRTRCLLDTSSKTYHQIRCLEQLSEKSKHAAVALKVQLRILASRSMKIAPHLFDELPKDIHVGNSKYDEDSGGDGCTNDAPNSTEGPEFRADGCSRCCYHDGSYDDDTALVRTLASWSLYRMWRKIEGKALRRMTEREKGADSHRGLTGSNETTGDQVDNGDVVSINGMAES